VNYVTARVTKIHFIKYAQQKKYIKSGISFENIDLYSRQINNLAFLHIPKAAGMSIVSAIYGSSSSNHAKALDYKKQDSKKFKDFDFFAISRNPYTRAYSAYTYLQKGGMKVIDEVWRDLYLKKYASFEDFILNGIEIAIYNDAEHFIPQYQFVIDGEGVICCDFLGKIEELDVTFNYLKNRNINVSIKHINQSKNEEINIKSIYTREMLDKINMLYSKDFSMFGYNML
jgi:hypothetical protein